MKPQILVTGANGQLGQTIQQLYNDRFTEKYTIIFASKNDLDITDKAQISSFFNTHHFKYCINCAAYTAVDKAEEEPEVAHKINAEAVKNIAEVCKTNHTILIHISTDYVFDGKKEEPYNEEDETNPINEYGKSKLAGENYVKKILEDYFIIRTSWLYSKYGKNFVKTISRKIIENSDLKVVTSEVGTPTNCIDLSGFIFHLIEKENKNFGIYHFSNLGKTTWYNFALEIAKYFPEYEIKKIQPTKSFKMLANRPSYSVMNKAKTESSMFKIPKWEDSLKIQFK